jgi:hypothetical protein
MADMGTFSYPGRNPQRNIGLCRVRYDTNNTSTPDGLVDPAGVVSAVAYVGVGIHSVTLKKRYRYVDAYVEHCDTTEDVQIKVTTIVEGDAAANVVTVQIEAAGSKADTTDKQVRILLALSR